MKNLKNLSFILMIGCLFVGSNLYAQKKPNTAIRKFNIDSVHISKVALGDFPYVKLPKGLKLLNDKPFEHSQDFLFFPIDGKMKRIEGHVWRAFITYDGSMGNGWSYDYFVKSLTAEFKRLGGVKIYEGRIAKTELDRIKDEATYFGDEGSIDYWNEKVLTYVIRRSDGHHIYLQLSGNSAEGQLQLVQQ